MTHTALHMQALKGQSPDQPQATLILRDEDPNTDEHTVELRLDSTTGLQPDQLDPNQHRLLQRFQQIVKDSLKLLDPEMHSRYNGTGPVQYSSGHAYWAGTGEIVRSSTEHEIPGFGVLTFTQTSGPDMDEVDTDPQERPINYHFFEELQHAEISTPEMPSYTSIFIQDCHANVYPPQIQKISPEKAPVKESLER